jgi:peptidoglycan hydrolase-like protein with peptidoglycan-binding domain
MRKNTTQHVIRYTAAVFVLSLFLPITALAQTYTYNSNWNYNDGSTETTTTRRERVRGYRQQSSEMQQKISALGTAAQSTIFVPILFGVKLTNISPNFGDPRSGGRTHEGEDIMGVKGTPIVTPTAAVVLRTVTGPSEGNTVYTANPGGETFVYMHLDRFGEGVTAGTVLAAGALIGYVGDTGNASGGPAHLHFEIHPSGEAPVDPYPRITLEIPLQEKMSYLTAILAKATDRTALAQFLVTNFRSTFNEAIAQNIVIPTEITAALASIPAPSSSPTTGTALPPGDLDVGSSGPLVTILQSYLIQSAKGSAATSLARAGSTGNFGPITRTALAEFQAAVGISPANGYYGETTRNYITSHPILTTPPVPIPTTPTPTTSVPTSTNTTGITRDLKLGMSGEDVRALQIILNRKGYTVATTGSGSVGNETTYFGSATQAAVIKFQSARNIAPAAGYVGPLTRAALSVQ